MRSTVLKQPETNMSDKICGIAELSLYRGMHGDVDDGAPENGALGHHEGQHGEGGGHRGGEAQDARHGEHGVGAPAEQEHPHQHLHLHTQGSVETEKREMFKRPFISGELLLTILIALYWRDKAEDFIFSEMMVLESCLMLQMTMVEVMMMMVRGQKKPKLKRKML